VVEPQPTLPVWPLWRVKWQGQTGRLFDDFRLPPPVSDRHPRATRQGLSKGVTKRRQLGRRTRVDIAYLRHITEQLDDPLVARFLVEHSHQVKCGLDEPVNLEQ